MDATHSTKAEPLVFTVGGVLCVTPACLLCHQTTEVLVDATGLDLWRSGLLIQRAFPMYDLRQLNLIETGMHEACWARMGMADTERDDVSPFLHCGGFFPDAGGPE